MINIITNIDKPIDRSQTKGNPGSVTHYGVALSAKQVRLLKLLPEFDSKTVVRKSKASMVDLAALTAVTGDEFAMFTKGRERLIIRGNKSSVNVTEEQAEFMRKEGYKWSGHTHPGYDDFSLAYSAGDIAILKAFEQNESVIYNSLGHYQRFYIL
ncbi:MAG: hypothetical protein LBM87_03455 [Ruminococcus sp.]|jgi:hypothetical protein|nr:hypothetical protein [Ruminococcus sp.]